jgi:hypothetical protein
VHAVPGCVTVNVWPPIDSVPARVVVVALAAAEKVTAPSPDPLAPAVTVSHGAPLDAVHAQPVADMTAIDPDPPGLGTVCVAGEIA